MGSEDRNFFFFFLLENLKNSCKAPEISMVRYEELGRGCGVCVPFFYYYYLN